MSVFRVIELICLSKLICYLLRSCIRRCAATGAQFVLHHQYQPKRHFARERDVSVSVLFQIGGQDSIADCASAFFVIH